MRNQNKIILASLLSIVSFAGCAQTNNDLSIEKEWVEGFDPVLEYKGDIDVFMYIYGQDKAWLDVGYPGKYGPEDIGDESQALFFAAAKEFKKLYPDIRINVYSGNGDEQYVQNFNNYYVRNGHVPHVIHHVNTTPELLTGGYVADLSQYKNKFETYNIINPELMKYFNYGGFQAAVPFGCYPTGLFINYGTLEDLYIESDDLVNNWTVATLDNIITAERMVETAGIVELESGWMNFIVPTIFKQYVENNTVDLTSMDVVELINMESNWYNYAAFDIHNQTRVGSYGNWQKNQMLIDGAARIMLGEQFKMGSLAQQAEAAGIAEDLDFYPWPALNEDSSPSIALDFGAINVGNQCPVGSDCSEESKLAQEAAAYFAMFMVADTRSIKAASEIEWQSGEGDGLIHKIGAIKGFPVVKKGVSLSFLDNEDEYETQLGYFFDNYGAYEGKPGFSMVLDLYEKNEIYVCSKKVFPFLVPEGGTGGTKDILEKWTNRYLGDGTTDVGSSTWTGWVESNLPIWTNDINRNSSTAWAYLTEQMISYYDLAADFDASIKDV